MLLHTSNGPYGAAVLRLTLSRSTDAPRAARDAIEDRFGRQMTGEAMADAKLVVSEVVTNAITHGEGDVTLKAAVHGDRLRLEIVDAGTGEAPAVRREAGDQTGGFGLRIVDALALRWGAFEGTTHVWAELPLG